AAESQRPIDVVLDPDQAVEHHRPAVVDIDVIGVDARVLAVVRIPAIDPELARFGRALRLWPGLAAGDPRIFRKREFSHYSDLLSFRGDAQHRTMVRNCAPENLEIPGLVLRTISGVWFINTPSPSAGCTERRSSSCSRAPGDNRSWCCRRCR